MLGTNKLRTFQELLFAPAESKPEPPPSTFSNSTTFCSTESSHACFGETKHGEVACDPETSKDHQGAAEDNNMDENVVPAKCSAGRWTDEEHKRFVEALEKFGKNWKKIQEYVGTRSTTQARSHAQKFFSKLEKTTPSSSAAKEPSGQTVPAPSSEKKHAGCVDKGPELPVGVAPHSSPPTRRVALKRCRPGRTHIIIHGKRPAPTPETKKRVTPFLDVSGIEEGPATKVHVDVAAENGTELKLEEDIGGETARPLELGERPHEEQQKEERRPCVVDFSGEGLLFDLGNVKEEPQ